ncbi:vegetative insecticidal protein Vip3A family protein [Erwinia sp. HDF1-3R]|uniref:vegetative insecticidal protein Vip3A family protein n=1 Tax=Erwinia sp. HDF1-3R TaxID=3141543 RepID=UPI0031F5AFCE
MELSVRQNNTRIMDVIGGFNTIYSFIDNIGSIFSSIANIGGNLDGAMSNAALWENIQSSLGGMSDDINTLLAQGTLTQAQIRLLIDMSSRQSKLISVANKNILAIKSNLDFYLPTILNAIHYVSSQNRQIIGMLGDVRNRLVLISEQLDNIARQISLNSSLAEMTSSYQAVKFVSERYDQFSEKLVELKNRSEDNNEILESDSFVELYEFAKRVTEPALNNIIYHLNTIHNSLVGKNILSTSNLQLVIPEFMSTKIVFNSVSSVSRAIDFLLNSQLIQAKALGAFCSCRAIMNYPYYDYASEMKSALNEQQQLFSQIMSKITPERNSLMATHNCPDSVPIMGEFPSLDKRPTVRHRAKKGYALLGFEFVYNETQNTFRLVVTDGKLGAGFKIILGTEEKYEYDVGRSPYTLNDWGNYKICKIGEEVITGFDYTSTYDSTSDGKEIHTYSFSAIYVSQYDAPTGALKAEYLPANKYKHFSSDSVEYNIGKAFEERNAQDVNGDGKIINTTSRGLPLCFIGERYPAPLYCLMFNLATLSKGSGEYIYIICAGSYLGRQFFTDDYNQTSRSGRSADDGQTALEPPRGRQYGDNSRSID